MAGRPFSEKAPTEAGSSSKPPAADNSKQRPQKPGPWPPKLEPFVPRTDHNPTELKSWAKRTGFNPNLSGETISSISERAPDDKNGFSGLDLEKGGPDQRDGSSPTIEIDPVLGRAARAENRGIEIEPASVTQNGTARTESDALLGSARGMRRAEAEKRRTGPEPVLGSKNDGRVGAEPGSSPKNVVLNGNGKGMEVPAAAPAGEPKKDAGKPEREVEIDMFSDSQEAEIPVSNRQLGMKYGLKENPAFPLVICYGIQHYLSLAGSLVFIPLVIVPAMGGTDENTATVISTMLLVSGLTTILHCYFGTRLPLVQGSSFVYLAPALVIINSQEFRNLSENKFKHTMRELQGAIIVGSIFQSVLGYTGLMSLLLRWINPVVVAPTVTAVGLAFFSFGFPQAGAYDHKSCNPDIPSSNILLDPCRRHVFTMKHCRTDASNAWKMAAWVRVPYPLQWGIPSFHFRTSFIMIIVSLVASVDSDTKKNVGSYHAASLLVNLKPPTPGIVSRGIGLEGFSGILAGLWGTGTGSTTLNESVRTIDITKMANRRVVEIGAALAASVLCFTWALVAAWGLSTLQYSQTASSRNIIVVGFTLFMSFSVPAYFQQYQPITSVVLPSYYVPFAAASNGPVHTGSKSVSTWDIDLKAHTPTFLPLGMVHTDPPACIDKVHFNYAINGLLSMNMVVALLVAFVLDNTVPGSKQVRGVYIWSNANDIEDLRDYAIPKRIGKFFRRAQCKQAGGLLPATAGVKAQDM
ncbi:hypothetical protein ACLOJK_003101 [Asimina triloba]